MERSKLNRRMGRVGIGMAVTALAIVAIWTLLPRERRLMEVARLIVKVAPEIRNYSDPENEATYWLSASQLLIVSPDPKNADRDRQIQFGVYAQKTWEGSADILDTTTHTRSRLLALTQLIQRTTARPMWRPDSFEMSPDGSWLQWQTYGGGDGWPCPRAAHLDGTHYREWACDKRAQENFFLDTRHLCQIEARDHPPMTVRDLLDPNLDRKCSNPEEASAVLAQYASRQPAYITVPAFDDAGASGRIEVVTYRMQDRLHLRLSSWADNPKAPSRFRPGKLTCPQEHYSDTEASPPATVPIL